MSTSLALAASVVGLSVVALLLATLVLLRYRRDRQPCHLYWGVGLFLVFVTLAQEAALYVGAWSEGLIESYLVLTAVLVGILSLGSAELSLRGRWKGLWFAYVGVTGVALAVVGFLYSVSPGIVVGGVVTGSPPTPTLVASTIVTVPSAILLIVSSLYGVVRQKRFHLLYITFGAVVLSVSGALYLVAFPVTLYYAEFVGVALLFLGFVKVPYLSVVTARPAVS